MNSPNQLQSISVGDSVRVPLDRLGDWMYSIAGQVYGAYSVNLMRSKMGDDERADHDQQWGLNFGDPKNIKIVPEQYDLGEDDPMSKNMAVSFKEAVEANPGFVTDQDEKG